jgi:hypothetical protein
MVKHSKRQTRKNAALHSQLFQEQALRWTSQLSGWNWEISAGNRNWMVKTYGFQIHPDSRFSQENQSSDRCNMWRKCWFAQIFAEVTLILRQPEVLYPGFIQRVGALLIAQYLTAPELQIQGRIPCKHHQNWVV